MEKLSSSESAPQASWDMSDVAPRQSQQEYVEKDLTLPPTDSMSKIALSPTDAMGADREDRSTTISVDGQEKPNSNILLGYNKEGFQLENGEYVSAEDMEGALAEYMAAQPDGTKFVRRSPRRTEVAPDQLADELFQAARKSNVISVSPAERPDNVDARAVRVSPQESQKDLPDRRGLFMFSKDSEVALPNGEFISVSELTKAAQNYLMLGPRPTGEDDDKDKPGPEDKPGPDSPTNPGGPGDRHIPTPGEGAKRERRYSVIKRFRESKAGKYLGVAIAATAVLIAVASPFTTNNVQAVQSEPSGIHYQLPEEERPSDEELLQMAVEQAQEKLALDIVTGESIDMPEGVEYHSASDARWNPNTKSAYFATEGLRQPGEYNIDYISILNKEGKIQQVAYQPGVSLQEFMSDASTKTGIPEQELIAAIHVGGPVSGWAYVDDIALKAAQESPADLDLSQRVVPDQPKQTGTGGTTVATNESNDLLKRAALGAAAGGMLGALAAAAAPKRRAEKTKMTLPEIEAFINNEAARQQDNPDAFYDAARELLHTKTGETPGSSRATKEALATGLIDHDLTLQEITNLTTKE